MKKLLSALVLLSGLFSSAQTYPQQNISLLSHIDPQSTVGIGPDNRKYSGCWGWYQASKNKEYGIVGSSAGTYFVDLTSPTTPTVCDYVPGKSGCTWREIKSYQNYCYIVSDDAAPNRFQIIDMQYLPDSVHVVHDGTSYFERGHTIWIDGNKMYIGSETKVNSTGYNSMTVYSLATPTNPVLLRSLNQDYSFVSTVHDMYAKNDTVYASCGNQGLYIFKFNSNNTFTQLGSFINYSPGSAYNHNSCPTANSKYLVFADEVPSGLPIRMLNIQNFSNVVQTSTIIPGPQATPHNVYVKGNRWAIVSCYQDGLYIYDINNPNGIITAGYFDTYPQGGINTGSYGSSAYRGNWGAYHELPSGIILALDMQNGVFVLDATAAFNQPVTVKDEKSKDVFLNIFPNPASKQIRFISNFNSKTSIILKDMLGKNIFEKEISDFNSETIDVSEIPNGTYILSATSGDKKIMKKVIINN